MVFYNALAFAVLLGLALAFVHYFSDSIHLAHRKRRMKILSFTAGIFLVYLFLDLLPTIHLGDTALTRFSLVFIVIGFSVLHLAEKFVYEREYKNTEVLKRELREIHSLSFFIYHFFIGILLVNILENVSAVAALLFFIPVFLHTSLSSLSLNKIHGSVKENVFARIALSFSTMAGILAGYLVSISLATFHVLLGLLIGVLLYIVIADSIPREREGDPKYFLLGIIVYSLLISVSWLV